MGSKEQQKALLNQQLEQLGSITNSPSVNKTSIIAHASKYIEELKETIDKLNEDVSTSQPSHHDHEDALPEGYSYSNSNPQKIGIKSYKPGLTCSRINLEF
ncbi:hypothetical protein AABB24_035622 [Solanum stoloniferum]|uniref:BHLH domain-containing protein n=1 Tax=Solanum stoloniferum TaxID=62892 RepID=A0ABD2R8D5_9SOLN